MHRLGLCLPFTCTNHEIKNLTQKLFNGSQMIFQKMLNIKVDVIDVRNMDINNFLVRPEVLWICVYVIHIKMA